MEKPIIRFVIDKLNDELYCFEILKGDNENSLKRVEKWNSLSVEEISEIKKMIVSAAKTLDTVIKK